MPTEGIGCRSVSLRRAATVLALVVCGLPASARAATGFAPAETLAGVGSPSGTVVSAMAPNGFAIAGWVETLGGGQSAIRVALRPPGRPWSAAQQLDVGSPSFRPFVSVAVDAAGDAVVAWDDATVVNNLQSDSTLVSTRTAGQPFGAPQTVTGVVTDPVVGIDQTGRVTLIDNETTSHYEIAREWAAGGTVPSAGTQVGANCSPTIADLAVAPGGDAVAGLECNGATFALRKAGAWSESTLDADTFGSCGMMFGTANSNFATDVQVAIDNQGNPAGVFLEDQRVQQCAFFSTANTLTVNLVLPLGANMQAVTPAVATGTETDFTGTVVSSPDVAVAGGSEIVSWNSVKAPSGLFDQNAQFFTANGASSGPAQKVGSGDAISRGNLAFSSSGYALDVFTTPGPGSTTSLSAASRAPGGSFGALTTLDPNAGGASDAIDDTGDGLAAFVQGSGASSTAQVRGFDVSPPTVTNASIPASATAGTPVAFSASASDFWGPVTISWNFGDGGSATGANPSHTFAAAGSPTVTVTATDSVGNTATKSRVVSVAAAPGGTKPPHAPVLSLVSITNSIFRIGPKPTAVHAAVGKRRIPVGTTFRFKLDESAKVSIVIEHPAGGRLSGGRCVKPTRKLAKHKRCTRYVLDGTLRRMGKAGADRVAFSGRIGRRRLGLGRHRAAISATAAGLRGRSRTLSFTIVR